MKRLMAAALAVGLCGSLQAVDPKALERQLETVEGEERVRLLNELSAATRDSAPRESAEWAAEAEELAERIGDEPGRARSLNSLGVAHYLLADYESALNYYAESLKLSERLGASEAIADALNNIGIVHYVRGEHERALEIARRTDDRTAMALTFNNLGGVAEARGRRVQALAYHNRSLEACRQIGDRRGEADSLLSIGELHNNIGEYQQARVFLTRIMHES